MAAPLRPFEKRIATAIADRYSRVYQGWATRALDEDAVRYHEAFHHLWILAAVARSATGDGFERDAWNAPRAVEKLRAEFSAITGTPVALN